MPVWVATEIMDFGCISVLCSGARMADRTEIAEGFDVRDAEGRGNGKALAHHSRLWNRTTTVQLGPKHLRHIDLLRHLGEPRSAHDRCYSALGIVSFLLRSIGEHQTWNAALRSVELMPSTIDDDGRGGSLHPMSRVPGPSFPDWAS